MTDMSISDMLQQTPRHSLMEQCVDLLMERTRKRDPKFFRPLVAYFFAKMAGSMNARVRYAFEDTSIPCNVYAIALAGSGYGKGYSVSIFQDELMSGFRNRFTNETFPEISDYTRWCLASERSAFSGDSEHSEKQKIDAQFSEAGPVPFTFSSATPQAVKAVREKMILGGLGSINYQMDEIAMNLRKESDALPVFFELWDKGHTEMRLILNSTDRKRYQELYGSTPTNMMMFGTPVEVFDGGDNQRLLMSLLAQGLARRCFFAWGEDDSVWQLTPEERLNMRMNQTKSGVVTALSDHFTALADSGRSGWESIISDDVTLTLFHYDNDCQSKADNMPTHRSVEKTELKNRASKAMKLAGIFAFVDETRTVTEDHIIQAIQVVEDSSEAFDMIINPEEPHIKMAKYMADVEGPQTIAQLLKHPVYKAAGGDKMRSELMRHAVSWGHTNNIVIRKLYHDTVEMWEGETLDKTSLDKVRLSHSDHDAMRYSPVEVPFEALSELAVAPDRHWCNHFFQNDHRRNAHIIQGFNLVVVDVDGDTDLDFVHYELQDYHFVTYTTKRHTDDEHRFRLIMPMSHTVKLDVEDYAKFMEGVRLWLPFNPGDDSMLQPAKKWLTNPNALVTINQGEDKKLLDALPFIPRTQKNEEFHESMEPLSDLDAFERWIATQFHEGNRNNTLLRYAMALVDKKGMRKTHEVRAHVENLNSRLQNGISSDRIQNTIMRSVARRIAELVS